MLAAHMSPAQGNALIVSETSNETAAVFVYCTEAVESVTNPISMMRHMPSQALQNSQSTE